MRTFFLFWGWAKVAAFYDITFLIIFSLYLFKK